MPTSYAVVGASRGIGLEYIRQLSSKADNTVLAVVRSKADSTHLTSLVANLKNVHVIEGDVTDHPSLERAAKEIAQVTGGKLDYLIHNAARMTLALFFRSFPEYKSMDELDADFYDAFKVNTLGVVHSIEAFLPLLRAGATKKIVVIGTGGAMLKPVRARGIANSVAYSATKAAATMVALKYALQLAPEGFIVVTLTPGVVDTSATTKDGPEVLAQIQKVLESAGIELEGPDQSIARQLKVIDGLTAADNGKCLAHDGAILE